MSIKRGEIYFVNLSPTVGREQTGRRPCVVISSNDINDLPLVVTVVAGTKGENIPLDYPTNVRLSSAETGLSMKTVFVCFQLRSLDAVRFDADPVGQLSINSLQKIEDAVHRALEL